MYIRERIRCRNLVPRDQIPRAVLAVCLLLTSVFVSQSDAQNSAVCGQCQERITLSPGGPLNQAKWNGCCRSCFFKHQQNRLAFTRHRYVTFADETLLDLKHFYATMRLTHFGMVFFGGRIQAVVFANAAGWLNEYRQFRKKRKTGHPLGTNEDLFSNFAGTIFAAFFYASYDSKKWPQQSVAIMESVYGPVKYVSKAKEISRSKRRRGQ